MTLAAPPSIAGAASIPARIATIRARFDAAAAPSAAAETSTTATEFADLLASLSENGATASTAATRSTQAASGATGDQIVELAKDYLGVPYLWGGTDPSKGLDCSGLVQLVLSRLGIDAPRVSQDQARFGTPVASLDQARPGDLVAFGSPRVNHIGIYVGNGQMLHAPRTGEVVKIEPIGNRELVAIRRVTGTAESQGAGAAGAIPGLAGLGAAGASGLPAAIVPAVRRFEALFVQAGQRWGIPPAVLAAQAQKESGGNVNAVSPAGARGLMQFMPATAASLGVNPSDPASSIDGAARYMSQMLRQFGSMELALAAYNAGPGAVRRAGNAVPPFAETRRYTREVLELAGGPR